MKYLLIDLSNILHRSYFAHQKEDFETLSGIVPHVTLLTMNKFYKEHKPDQVILCLDRSNWRKAYTQDKMCYSGRVYKGTRRDHMSKGQQDKYRDFLEVVTEFEYLMREKTKVVTLHADWLEADDLIAGFCQMYKDDEIIIVSGDKDFMQLLRPGVTLIDTATCKKRECDDVEYFLFEKCMRGEIVDNVQSALPRVRTARLKKAFVDPIELVNLMKETWLMPIHEDTPYEGAAEIVEESHDGEIKKYVKYTVEDLYEENRMLMDLSAQPDNIKALIKKTIEEGMSNRGKFDYFHFMQYLGKKNLEKIAKSAEQFIPMLSR